MHSARCVLRSKPAQIAMRNILCSARRRGKDTCGQARPSVSQYSLHTNCLCECMARFNSCCRTQTSLHPPSPRESQGSLVFQVTATNVIFRRSLPSFRPGWMWRRSAWQTFAAKCGSLAWNTCARPSTCKELLSPGVAGLSRCDVMWLSATHRCQIKGEGSVKVGTEVHRS